MTRHLDSSAMSRYGVFSGLNTGKYGLGKIPYLDTFHVGL